MQPKAPQQSFVDNLTAIAEQLEQAAHGHGAGICSAARSEVLDAARRVRAIASLTPDQWQVLLRPSSHSLSQVLREFSLRARNAASYLDKSPLSETRSSQVRAELRLMAREAADWSGVTVTYPQDLPATLDLLYLEVGL